MDTSSSKKTTRATRKPATGTAAPQQPKATTPKRVNKTQKGEEFMEIIPGDTVWRLACRSASLSNTVLNFDKITEEKKRLEALNPSLTELIPGLKVRRW